MNNNNNNNNNYIKTSNTAICSVCYINYLHIGNSLIFMSNNSWDIIILLVYTTQVNSTFRTRAEWLAQR